NSTKLERIIGNLVQLWVQYIPGNRAGGTECTPIGEVPSGPSDLSGLRNKSNHEFLGLVSKGEIRSMAQENLRSLGESKSGYGYTYENDPKTSCERTWGDSKDDDQLEKDATCLMKIESQEVYPNSSISNLHELQ
ncbi:hypothetical protein Tco_0731903, partial [Tanacetum coccineum]